MDNSSSNEIYKDVKLFLKKTLLVIAVIIATSVVAILIYLAYDRFQSQKREAAILEEALPFAKAHESWVYIRNDFGKESKLELWLIGDTDHHAIIKVNGQHSVYSTTNGSYGSMNFYHKAGEACGYASAYVSKGEITSVSCGSNTYSGGPWNKFR